LSEDLGEMRLILGMECILDKKSKTMKLTQAAKIIKLAKQLQLSDSGPTLTPYNPSLKIVANEEESVDPGLYQSAIGSLWYSARCMRPDINFIVSLLAQHQKNPSQKHWGVLKHLVRYLNRTLEHGIVLGVKGVTNTMFVAADSSFADVQRSLYSTSGFCCLMGHNVIAWMSQKQSIHAMSSAEAEYYAASDAIKETLWIQELIKVLNTFVKYKVKTPMTLFIDSKACFGMIQCGEPGARHTKHIELKQHVIHSQSLQ
jgi:hypothetical protein